MRRTRALALGALAAAVTALAACAPQSATPGAAPAAGTTPAGSGGPAASAPPAPSQSAASGPSGTAAAGATAATPAASPAAARTGGAPAAPSKAASRPPVPTRLSMSVSTRDGRLALRPGGPAQEFSVTVRNGNSRDYRHLLLAFQMEAMPGGSLPGYVLERRDQATGSWRPAALRIANDVMPHAVLTGGSPLARDTTVTHRYRLRALADAPAGYNPLMVALVDTDADTGPAATSLPQTTLAR
ncbi:hypothetical protein [Streptomyces sp. NPDC012888]|uniref:hypothetical protein n=1 Tax=Streptomyces sp. NPDC012888 TaxID=3364855 RepID=UPI00368BD1AD